MKSIIITGASGGIGRACADVFLADGWRVGLIARRAALLEEVAAGQGGAVVLPCDVTDEGAVAQAFSTFAAKAGRLDVLFNNAGVFTPAAPIDEIPVADWTRAVAVNLTGMFLCARAAFGQMRHQSPQGGRIINNGSISAHVPRDGSVTYTTTKHGVTGLTKTLSLDGRPFDIACGQIDIGNARTDMVAELAKSQPGIATMDVGLVADAVLRMAQLPPEANVQFQTFMATKMPYIGRG
ncbi:SDR family oxidoreductase [Octadecabacter sp. R77987]|uniref:SDR family oxidoreductase n=1 Tax=Octadecabacter sp. R77987 TaxID=3093874 RepID=UPI0036710DCB